MQTMALVQPLSYCSHQSALATPWTNTARRVTGRTPLAGRRRVCVAQSAALAALVLQSGRRSGSVLWRPVTRAAAKSSDSRRSADSKGAPRGNLVVVVVSILLWYAINVYFNIFNKRSLDVFPHAWTVSVMQLLMVVVCSAIGWLSGALPSPWASIGRKSMRWLLPAAFFHALGNGFTSVALSWGSVSFTHVVKTSEPFWMALGNLLLNGSRLPRSQALAILPIMLGVALASAGEVSFTWLGFLAAVGSTISFAARVVFTKGLMGVENAKGQKISAQNAFALDSLVALAFTLPVALAIDGPCLLGQGLVPGAGPAQAALLAKLLAATGLTYYAYNALGFQMIGLLDVVTWAVVNLGKRVFVIGFSVVALQTPLTQRALWGSLMALAGSGLYSYAKMKT
eukprot:TRINITY_DN40290_c0_g1_i1.p1 TRINITY_DN40290_c0_g1~~TRINITY_DN40290_c0_g1_i1.p1  ORF type:complete len:398 (-),score=52.16 TRINITY_DN40290_c0_g1_i1:80-1273(-)